MDNISPNSPSRRVLIAERRQGAESPLTRAVATSGAASVLVRAHGPEETLAVGRMLRPDVVLVDLDLSPDCSLVAQLRIACPSTRVIAVSHPGQPRAVIEALALGAVAGLDREPAALDLDRALATSADAPVVGPELVGFLLDDYLDLRAGKRSAEIATINALAAALEVRDSGTGKHLHRVAALANACMGVIDPSLARNEDVSYGFMLHDVGKIGVPDEILNKPGPLDQWEFEIMRRHPEMGMKIVEPAGFSSATVDIILSHHERWDGSGYPRGLAREDIPITARAFAIADAFDAMTSDRPYRTAMGRERVLEVISDAAGSAYDPDIVDAFVDLDPLIDLTTATAAAAPTAP
jgi:HD-GYP domain-containing protein (c-di-GMP phosphodiesterase class II)